MNKEASFIVGVCTCQSKLVIKIAKSGAFMQVTVQWQQCSGGLGFYHNVKLINIKTLILLSYISTYILNIYILFVAVSS